MIEGGCKKINTFFIDIELCLLYKIIFVSLLLVSLSQGVGYSISKGIHRSYSDNEAGLIAAAPMIIRKDLTQTI